METLKGIVFSIESVLKNAKKSWVGKDVVVKSSDIFPLIEKLKEAIDDVESKSMDSTNHDTVVPNFSNAPSDTQIIDAQKEMFRMKKEANDYADSVLARLQLAITKLQKNTIKMEKNIAEGRKLIQQKQLNQ